MTANEKLYVVDWTRDNPRIEPMTLEQFIYAFNSDEINSSCCSIYLTMEDAKLHAEGQW